MTGAFRRAGPRRASGPAALVLLAAAAVGAGCLGAGPAAPPDRYHRLELGAAELPSFPTPAIPGVVEVARLRGNAITTQRAIAWTEAGPGGHLRQHAYDYWVDPPPEMLQELLVRALRESGAAAGVAAPEALSRGDYRVSGRIVRFEQVLGEGGPAVAVEVRLTLTRLRGREPVLSRTYAERVPVDGEGVDEAIPAFDRAVDRIVARFLTDLGSASPG